MKSAFRELDAYELELVSGGEDGDVICEYPPPGPPPYEPEFYEPGNGGDTGDGWGEGGAGSVDTRGVNELLSYNPTLNDVTSDHVFVTNGNGSLILADYDKDGVYDRAWTSTSSGWVSSTDGQTWSANSSDPDPIDAIDRWVASH